MKRTVQLLTCALVFTSSAAFADAITGAPVTSYSEAARAADEQSSNASVATEPRADGTLLFDASGASLLLMSPPHFLFIGAHQKLRDSGSDSSLNPGGVLNGLTSGVPSGTLGNVGFGSAGTTLNPVSAAVPILNPEPASLILLGSGLAFCARQLKRRRV